MNSYILPTGAICSDLELRETAYKLFPEECCVSYLAQNYSMEEVVQILSEFYADVDGVRQALGLENDRSYIPDLLWYLQENGEVPVVSVIRERLLEEAVSGNHAMLHNLTHICTLNGHYRGTKVVE